MITFLAVLLASPLFLSGLTAAVAAPLRPVAGTPVRIAVANSRRNPGRSAVTAAALMIGIGLMALFSVLISSIRATATEQLAEQYPFDYLVTGMHEADRTRAGIPGAMVAELRSRPEFSSVLEAREVDVTVAGEPATIGGLNTDTEGVLLYRVRPWTQTVQPGDTVTVSLGDKEFPLTVSGFGERSIPGTDLVDLRIPWSELQRIAGQGDDTAVMVKARPDVSAVASRDILDSYLDRYPLLEISSMADISDQLESQVAGLVGLFGGLLGMTVLIAIFGIANTLSLAVVERTRESATMRAIGLTRGQLRGTLLYEAVFLGVVAGAVGVGLELLFGRILLLKALSDFGATIVVPWNWLGALLGLTAVACVIAAVLPARRAAGASIVAAMSDS